MTYTLIPDLARAYHCPQAVMAYIAHRHPGLLATIEELGPMRMHYDREWGWMLNGTPVHFRRDPVTGTMGFHPTIRSHYGRHVKAWRREQRNRIGDDPCFPTALLPSYERSSTKPSLVS